MLILMHVGINQFMRQILPDNIAVSNKVVKLDIFLIVTSSTHWPEAREAREEGLTLQDWPDITARVFRSKLELF